MNLNTKYKYDTFNARYLSIEEVATTFIPNSTFGQLIANNHSLLMGPRGCGKTTLLKMLTPKAVATYNSRNSAKSKIHLPFIGIYIPSDKQWQKQLFVFETHFKTEEKFVRFYSRHIVTTNIVLGLINTFIDLAKIFAQEEDEDLHKEAAICNKLIDRLELKKPLSPNFLSIISSLKSRIVDINIIANKISANLIKGSDIEYPNYIFPDFLPIIDFCCAEFERIYENDLKKCHLPKRWAMCFDELEISPSWLQQDLITNHLRSRDQRFLFKLTTTPLVDAKFWLSADQTSQRPSQNEDYKIIRNWVFDNETNELWKDFSESLFISLIKREFLTTSKPEEIFGKTAENIDEAITPETLQYAELAGRKSFTKGSIEWHIFRMLAERDKAFYNFLSRKEILPFDPVSNSLKQENEIFRKIKQIVYHRFYFKKGTGYRSRKVVDLYSGTPLIYEVGDGNPRTLLNLFDTIKSKLVKENSGRIKKLKIAQQARIIKTVSLARLEGIKNHPAATITLDDKRRVNLGELLAEIGTQFYNGLMQDPFTGDPVGTFIIDGNLDSKIVELLKFGLNIGAIQYINPKQDISDEDVYNKHYRLSFSIYPSLNLPLREYGVMQLSKILPQYSIDRQTRLMEQRKAKKLLKKNKPNTGNQSELFDK